MTDYAFSPACDDWRKGPAYAIKENIRDLSCGMFLFFKEQGCSQDHAMTAAHDIVKMYTDTIKRIAVCGYLKDHPDV